MIFVWNYQLSSFVENKDLRSFVAKWWKLQFAHFWGKLSQEIPAARKVIAFPCTDDTNDDDNDDGGGKIYVSSLRLLCLASSEIASVSLFSAKGFGNQTILQEV